MPQNGHFDRIAVKSWRAVAFDLALTRPLRVESGNVGRVASNPYLRGRVALKQGCYYSKAMPVVRRFLNLRNTKYKQFKFFLLRDVIYAKRGLVGRDSMVYETLARRMGSRPPKEFSNWVGILALALSSFPSSFLCFSVLSHLVSIGLQRLLVLN